MEAAKRAKESKIIVIKVKQDMIFDFMELAKKLNFDKDEERKAVPFSKIREMVADSDEPYKLKIRTSLDSNTHQTICVQKSWKTCQF